MKSKQIKDFKIESKRVFSNLSGNAILKTKQWTLSVTSYKKHIYAVIHGPNGYRKAELTSITDDLSQFERKVVLLHIFREARNDAPCGNEKSTFDLKSINYADVFGGLFD